MNMGVARKSKTMKSLEKLARRSLSLGGLMESIRQSEEVSLSEFSERLGLSPSHLCDIEKGRKMVSPRRATRFAEVLERSPEQFVRLSLQGLVDEAGLKMKVSLARVK